MINYLRSRVFQASSLLGAASSFLTAVSSVDALAPSSLAAYAVGAALFHLNDRPKEVVPQIVAAPASPVPAGKARKRSKTR